VLSSVVFNAVRRRDHMVHYTLFVLAPEVMSIFVVFRFSLLDYFSGMVSALHCLSILRIVKKSFLQTILVGDSGVGKTRSVVDGAADMKVFLL
jgi:hypothetical protein